MKYFLSIFVSLLLATVASAGPSEKICPTVYEQLVQLNEFWKQNKVEDPTIYERKCFNEHTDLIQLHLKLVRFYTASQTR